MSTRNSLLTLGLACIMLFGCAHKQKEEPDAQVDSTVVKFEQFRQTYDEAVAAEDVNAEADAATYAAFEQKVPAPAPNADATSIVLSRAHKAIGTPYVFGGTHPGGFDCSGFVQWAYKGAGISLPRTAGEQARSGFAIRDKSKMRAGDIVAFRRRGGYHTGIYLGGGKFIHAPSRHKRVRIESIDSDYFASRFVGARRMDMNGRSVEVAARAERQDQQYASSSKSRVQKGKTSKSQKSVASSKRQSSKTVAAKSGAKKAAVASKKGKGAQSVAKASKAAESKSASKAKSSSAKAAQTKKSAQAKKADSGKASKARKG